MSEHKPYWHPWPQGGPIWWMTDEERDYLVREATERGIRLSEYIRRALLLNMSPVNENNA